MKSLFSLLIASGFILFCISCRNSHQYDKQIKELDSLKIVVEQALINFKTVDSTECTNAYSKQFTYASFINGNLKDTVDRKTAVDLQLFYMAGKTMRNYLAHRTEWINEANTCIAQLKNLCHDLKNNSVNENEAVDYILTEKNQAISTIGVLNQNTTVMRSTMDQYNQSVSSASAIALKLNNDVELELVMPKITAKPKKH